LRVHGLAPVELSHRNSVHIAFKVVVDSVPLTVWHVQHGSLRANYKDWQLNVSYATPAYIAKLLEWIKQIDAKEAEAK
jgi:hypothetical protein